MKHTCLNPFTERFNLDDLTGTAGAVLGTSDTLFRRGLCWNYEACQHESESFQTLKSTHVLSCAETCPTGLKRVCSLEYCGRVVS